MSEKSLLNINQFFLKFIPLIYKKKDIILQAEEVSLNIFYIISGYVRAYRISEQGEELTLVIFKPGDFFPLTWGTNNILDDCYLEAVTDVKLWKAPKEEFIRFINEKPELYYDLANNLLSRYSGLFNRIEYLVFGTAYTKVAAALVVCAKRFGKSFGEKVLVDLPLTHRDIATLIGITRETTCLEMKKLEKKGLITHNGRMLVIQDLKRMEIESQIRDRNSELLNNSF